MIVTSKHLPIHTYYNNFRPILCNFFEYEQIHSKRKQPPKVFCKKGCSAKKFFLRKSSRRQPTILLKKRLCHRYFPANVTKTCNFIKKETLTQVFFYQFCKISKNTYFTEPLWVTASE